MIGAIVKVSPLAKVATRRAQRRAPVSVLSARRNPSGVPRTSRPSLIATPRLRPGSNGAGHGDRHLTRQVVASIAIVLHEVVRNIVPRWTIGTVWKLSRSPTWNRHAGARREAFAAAICVSGEKRVPA